MASVDVIVPCYNYARFLRECVGSVLAQEGVAARVLIIDDCSTDDSAAVGRALAAEDPRVEFRRHEKNRGHIATYNEGLEWVAGDYCLLLSADDLITRGALGRAAALLDAHPQVGMVYGDIIRTEAPDFAAVPAPPTYGTEVTPGSVLIEDMCRGCCNLVDTATAVVRTTVHKAIGGYRKELPHAGDLEMWLRCASVSAIGRIRAPQGFYRRHGTNMSCDYGNRRDYEQVKSAFRYFFAEFGGQLPDRERFEALTHKGLARQAFYLANDAFDAGDARTCDAFLREARAHWADVSRDPGWRRLRLKRVLGTRFWGLLRRLLGRRARTHSA
jgi:glycosyltransferase involved in cell wall biosynthesis